MGEEPTLNEELGFQAPSESSTVSCGSTRPADQAVVAVSTQMPGTEV